MKATVNYSIRLDKCNVREYHNEKVRDRGRIEKGSSRGKKNGQATNKKGHFIPNIYDIHC